MLIENNKEPTYSYPFMNACAIAISVFELDNAKIKLLLDLARLDQLKVLCYDGTILGYVAFYKVKKDGFNRFRFTGQKPIYKHELDEGSLTIIEDVVFLQKRKKLALNAFKTWLSQQKALAYMRNRRVVAAIRWNRKLYRLSSIKLE